MKRYLVAAGIGSLVFAGALGSAAALDINDAGVAQYGDNFDLACDENGVTVDGYFPDTDPGGPSVSNGVVVSGISPLCFGKTLVAGVTDENGNGLARGWKEITASTMTIQYNDTGYPSQVPYADLDGIRLTIG